MFCYAWTGSFAVQFRITPLSLIGWSNTSNQGDKCVGHSKLIRNVAGGIFPRGGSAEKAPRAQESRQLRRLLLGWLFYQPRNVSSHVTVRPVKRPSSPQGNQCAIKAASVGACNLILHIPAVVNWQLSKEGICWPVSHDHIRCRHRGYADRLLLSTDRRLNSKWISLRWLQDYCLK